MPIENLFRQESDQANPTLTDAYGVQATHGLPHISKTEGGQTSFISFLAARECNRALKVFYGAFLLTEYAASGARQWRFHSGKSSDGFDDPIQGRPEFFPEIDDCYTEICYIEVRPPADFGEIDPNKLFVIFEGLITDDYAIDGDGFLEVIGRGFFVDPMHVGLDILRRGQRMPLTRFHAVSWLAYLAHCIEAIAWVGGEGDGLLAEYFNNTTLTAPATATQVEPIIYFDFSAGARVPGVGEAFSVRLTGQFKSPTTETITFITNTDDGIRLWVNGVQIINDWAQGYNRENSGSIALVADTKYDIVIEYWQAGGYGNLRMEYESATITRQIVPIDRLFSAAGNRQIQRWTAHVAFPQAISPALAFESVMQRSPDCHWQDVGVNGKIQIKMLVGTDRPVVQSFYFNPNQQIIRSNIAYNSFYTYPRPAEETPNFFHVSFRDVDRIDEILPEKFLPIDRPELREKLDGFLMDLGVIPLGVMTQSQADRTGETMMRLGSDLNRFVILRGMKGSHKVAKGDYVEVVHNIPNWTLPRLFMVLEESFTRGNAGERDFLLQSISTEFSSDTAHGRIQWNARADNLPAFVPPPPASFVDIAEGLYITPDGTQLPTIEGTVEAADHPYPQRLRIWIKYENAVAWQLTDRMLIPDPDSHQASFQIVGVPKTISSPHQVKVVSESQAGGLKLPFADHPIAFVNITNALSPTPAQPTGFSGAILGQQIRWSWNAPSADDLPLHSHYEMFTDAALTVFANGGRRIDTTFLNENIAALGAVDRWLVAVNKSGKRSVAATAQATVAAVPNVTGFGISYDGTNLIADWVEVTDTQERIIGYRIYDASNIAIGFAEKPPFIIRPTAPSTTLRIKAMDRAGNLSPAFVSDTEVITPPTAPPSGAVTFDGAQVITRWNPSAAPGVVGYDIRDGANALLRADVPATEFREQPTPAQASYTRRVYSIDRFGQRSTAYLEIIKLFVAPDPPADASGAWNGDEVVWTITPPAVAPQGVDYYQARTTAGVLLASRLTSPEFRQPHVLGQADYTTRFYAVDGLGLVSGMDEETYSIARPAAPASLNAQLIAEGIDWNWPIPASPYLAYFEIEDSTARVLKQEARNRWTEQPTFGVTSYTRNVYSVNRAGLRSLAPASKTYILPAPSTPSGYSLDFNGRQLEHRWQSGIAWASLVGVTVGADNSITKTGGVDAAWDAGAISVETIADNGFIEFQPAQANLAFMVGLNAVNVGAAYSDIDFAIYCRADSVVEVYESNVSRGTFGAYAANDVFRIGIEYGVVRYYRNGTLFYTSTIPPVANLAYFIDVSLAGTNAKFYGVRMLGNVNEEIEIAADATFANILARTRGNYYAEPIANSTARGVIARYLRAVSRWGSPSASISAAYTNAAPAAPTITKDANLAAVLVDVVRIHVAAAIPRNPRILATVVQVRRTSGSAESFPASTAEGTDRVFRFPGLPTEIDVPYAAGGSIETRVSHEDLFSPQLLDHQWSSALAHTFPRFNDGAIDPASNFLLKNGDRLTVGGGVFGWAADFKFSWTTQISILGFPTASAPARQVDIASNAAGTTILAGQRMIASHTIGSNTATVSVVDVATYTPPDETSTTEHYYLAERRPDDTLKLFTGHILDPARFLDASVLIPRLASFIADFKTLLVDDANINTLRANKIIAQLLDAWIVFADRIGSRNFVAFGSVTAQTEAVEWQNAANVTIQTDQRLLKSGGVNATWDAGAISTRSLHTGDGWVSLTSAGAGIGNNRYIGFLYGNSITTWADLDFGIGFTESAGANVVYVVEAGVVKTSAIPFVIGDSIKVDITGSNIRYYLNATLVYTSSLTPTRYPLRVGAAMAHLNQYMERPNLRGLLRPTTGINPRWRNRIGVALNASDDLYKTSATAGYNAGAFSMDSLPANQDGAVSVIVDSIAAGQDRLFGLSTVDTNQDYATLEYGCEMVDTRLFVFRNGTSVYSSGAGGLAVGNVVSISREAGKMRVRRNGVLLFEFSGSAPTSELFVDTSFNNQNGILGSVRLNVAGAIAQGWAADNTGLIELGKGARIAGLDLFESQLRSLSALASDRRYRGNDTAALELHKVAGVKLAGWVWDESTDNVEVRLAATVTGFDSDAYANADSLMFVSCRVLNQFAEEVAVFAPLAYRGDGLCAAGVHSRKYADPVFQAIYVLRFYNKYGYSTGELFFQNGVQSLTQPTAIRRANTALELCVAGQDAGAAVIGNAMLIWKPTDITYAGQYQVQYKRPTETAWRNLGAAITATSLNIMLDQNAPHGDAFDFRVYNTSAFPSISNVVRVTLPPVNTTIASPPPTGINIQLNAAGSQATINWTLPTPVAHTSSTVYRYDEENGTITTVGTTGAGIQTINDATIVRGKRYWYTVTSNYGGAITRAGKSARIDTPVSSNAADPTNMRVTAQTETRVDWAWNVNAAVGAVTLQVKEILTGDDPSLAAFWASGLTTVALSAGVQVYPHTLTTNKNWAGRVIVADAGTSPSNVARGTTIPPKGGGGLV